MNIDECARYIDFIACGQRATHWFKGVRPDSTFGVMPCCEHCSYWCYVNGYESITRQEAEVMDVQET
jgi:hypothetical protein